VVSCGSSASAGNQSSVRASSWLLAMAAPTRTAGAPPAVGAAAVLAAGSERGAQAQCQATRTRAAQRLEHDLFRRVHEIA